MNLKQLQKWVKDDWEKKSKKEPDSHLQLIYLFEELGEMSEAIRKSGGDKKHKKNKTDLEEEIGDVLISLTTIANNYKIDLTSAIKKSRQKIIKRHHRGF